MILNNLEPPILLAISGSDTHFKSESYKIIIILLQSGKVAKWQDRCYRASRELFSNCL